MIYKDHVLLVKWREQHLGRFWRGLLRGRSRRILFCLDRRAREKAARSICVWDRQWRFGCVVRRIRPCVIIVIGSRRRRVVVWKKAGQAGLCWNTPMRYCRMHRPFCGESSRLRRVRRDLFWKCGMRQRYQNRYCRGACCLMDRGYWNTR